MLTTGAVEVIDQSNGPKTLEQPEDCHCHCAPIVTNVHFENGNMFVEAVRDNAGKSEHVHPGKGGWWKNNDCKICTPKL